MSSKICRDNDEAEYGHWLILGNSEYGREKMWARIHLMPLLQAETDRDQVRRHYADKARAKELLGDNDIQVYYTDKYDQMNLRFEAKLMVFRFIKPTYGVVPSKGGPGDLR